MSTDPRIVNNPFSVTAARGLNISYARKVLDYAKHEAEDYRFDMNYWMEREKRFTGIHTKPQCRTSACLAGTAVLLDPDSKLLWFDETGPLAAVMVDRKQVDVEERACELLGIDRYTTTAQHLFYCENDEALDILERFIEAAEAEQHQL